MRIIAGTFKGRTLRGPTGAGVRPTSDSLRETLFNVLRDRVVDARVLDGFAGTGAVGLEALSRGAASATFIERDPRVVTLLEKNIAACGAGDRSTVVRDAFVGVGRRRRLAAAFGVVFIDPPYDIEDLEAAVLEAAGLVAPAGMVVVEHSRRREVTEAIGGLQRLRLLTAGDSALSFYGAPEPQ